MQSSGEINKGLTEEEVAEVKSSARAGFKWVLSSTLFLQIVSWLATLYTLRILTPRDYGLIALPDAVFPYLMMLATFKLDLWLLQISSDRKRAEELALYLLLILALISTAIGILSAPLLAWFYRYPELETLAKVMCLMFLPRVLRLIPESRLRRDLKLKQLSLINLTVGLFRNALQILLALAAWGYWALVFGAIFSEVLSLIVLVYFAGLPGRIRLQRPELGDALRYGLSATGATVLWIIFSTADNLIVGKLFGAEALGIYATAFMLTELPLAKFNATLSPLLEPLYSRLKDNPTELLQAFLKVNGNVFLFLVPSLLGLSLVAEQLVPLVFSEKWLGLVWPIKVLSCVAILRALSSNVSSLCYATAKPGIMLRSTFLCALVLPPAFFLGGKFFGLNGIMLVWLLIYPLVGPLFLAELLERQLGLNKREFFRNYIPALVSGALMYVLIAMLSLVFGGSAIELLAFKTMVGGISYLLFLRLFFKNSFSELIKLCLK